MEVQEYKIVSQLFKKKDAFRRYNEKDFEDEVNGLIQQGYQLYGKLEISYERSVGLFNKYPVRRFTQVLIK